MGETGNWSREDALKGMHGVHSHAAQALEGTGETANGFSSLLLHVLHFMVWAPGDYHLLLSGC